MINVPYLRHGAAVICADGDEGRGVAVAIALGSMALGIAQLAVDFAVRSITRDHGVQRAMALAAVVAGLVPLLFWKMWLRPHDLARTTGSFSVN